MDKLWMINERINSFVWGKGMIFFSVVQRCFTLGTLSFFTVYAFAVDLSKDNRLSVF